MIRFAHMNPVLFGTELLFSAIVIVLCMIIYFKTKDMYELTRHRGIRYFRNTFLFFALAFLFRFGFHLFVISGLIFDFRIPRYLVGPIPLLGGAFFSMMGIFYLLLSMSWKRLKWRYSVAAAYFVSAILAIIIFVDHSPHILALVQSVLVMAGAIIAYLKSRKSKGFAKLFLVYLLLFLAWVANIIVMSPRFLVPIELKIGSYALTIIVFSIILYKVLRRTK